MSLERQLRKRWPLVHRRIVENEWQIQRKPTGKGHVRIVHLPTGRKLSMPATPTDYRGQRNALAYMKRIDTDASE